ncbi:MAG: hypothetical protein KUG82_12420 [Pseudomonadales bacterium]|nr:hypothetical protein [Pseudomonadales bacterium]
MTYEKKTYFIVLLIALISGGALAEEHNETDLKLNDRITRLESLQKQTKLTLPGAEIPYLYKMVFNHKPEKSIALKRKLIDGLNLDNDKSNIIYNKKTKSYDINNRENESETTSIPRSDPAVLLAMMVEIEEFLGVDVQDKTDIIARIRNGHNKIDNKDWDSDHIRFGLLTSTTMHTKTHHDFVTESLVLHVYPAYRRFIPGKYDLRRRISFFIGVGDVIAHDVDVSTAGVVYSLGIGIDIAKGVTIAMGAQRQQTKVENIDNDFDSNSELFLGVTLNKDFWKKLVAQ